MSESPFRQRLAAILRQGGRLGCLGRPDEAREAGRRLLELTPRFTVAQCRSIAPFKDAQLRELLREKVLAAGVPT
jgi:hypothetical protein